MHSKQEPQPTTREAARYAWGDLVSVPSLLSLSRVPLAVLFVFVVRDPTWAVLVLALAGLSDVLDGWWARRFNQCTAIGALVDGATDKILVLCVAWSLWHAQLLSLQETLMLGVRDAGEVLVTLWVSLRRDQHALHEEQRANTLGKLTTFLQFTATILAILRLRHFELCVATAVAGAITAVSYARRSVRA
ncbi:MAG: CDP-alcohol phosphatidyltransferase family protein [Deltaproteobacteria bacterium]|nr:CDP-alcohol phosphatidyltransferase family protein [Deltaproteobacteria bacterium]